MKAAWPSAPWVQIEDACIVTFNGLMSVPAYDRVESGGLRFEVEVLEVVKHIKTKASGLDDGGKRQFLRPGLRVHIAAYGKHGRDEFELRENFGSAHVSRVDDELHTEQGALCFRAEQAVSIGNDTDPHGGLRSL